MKTAIKIFRAFLVALLILVVGFPAICYVMLSTPWAQNRMRLVGQEALSILLNNPVTIKSVSFSPFNRLNIDEITLLDSNDSVALNVNRLRLRVELSDLILSHKMIVDYAVIDGLNANIYKKENDSVLNISSIIEKFKKKDDKKSNANLLLRLNNLEIVNANIRYNDWNKPAINNKFDPNHIEINNLRFQAFAPKIYNGDFSASLRTLQFKEKCGFELDDMEGKVILSKNDLKIEDFFVELPNSKILFDNVNCPLGGVGKNASDKVYNLEIERGSVLHLPDLSPFVPSLSQWDINIQPAIQLSGLLDSVMIRNAHIECGEFSSLVEFDGCVLGLPKLDSLSLHDFNYRVENNRGIVGPARHLLKVEKWPSILTRALESGVKTVISGKVDGGLANLKGNLNYESNIGKINSKFDLLNRYHKLQGDVDANIIGFDLGDLLGQEDLGDLNATISVDGSLKNKKFKGKGDLEIESFVFKDYKYQAANAKVEAADSLFSFAFSLNDPNVIVGIDARLAQSANGYKWAVVRGDVRNVNLHRINLTPTYEDYRFSAQLNAYAQGVSPSSFQGGIVINDLRYVDAKRKGLKMRKFNLEADNTSKLGHISINSDYLNGNLEGDFDLSTLPIAINNILADVMPSLVEPKNLKEGSKPNDFTIDFTISDAENPCQFFNLPVTILDPVNITGAFNQEKRNMWVNVDADWLLQGDKLVENTYLFVDINGAINKGNVYLTSLISTKKGPMNLLTSIDVGDGDFFSTIDWEIIRDIPINGRMGFDLHMSKREGKKFDYMVDFKPGEITFGDEVWSIQPSKIFYSDNLLTVDNFALVAPTESVRIHGTASDSNVDVLEVKLDNITLIDIFETLEIDKALICGNATGTIHASQLFSPSPIIESTKFNVQDMGYNGCVIGDADMKIGFDNETQSVTFDADIKSKQGYKSKIYGSITPATEGLDFYFDADHVKVGFLKPFMEAFCSDIDGYATGKAHLFGDFKYIDLEGDIMADSVRLKIDFTNTWYSTSTPLHITPGVINLDDITIYDIYGNTAKLNGAVRHKYFKEPSFDFAITQARNFLSYDIKEEENPRWYGTIFGNGSAFVKGEPGIVNITVDMSTAPHSTFTFALLDSEEAAEYSFIVFNDVTPAIIADEYIDVDIESEAQKRIENHKRQEDGEIPTAYNIDISVDITTSAEVNVVMDPIGGDAIKAHGQGMLRLNYGSVDEDLKMVGKYTLDNGTYNFTLQDIIIKEFKIRQGSSITFTGDPYTAVLDINAIYSTKANISDLDESFLSDKELVTRTNTPVYAVLLVTGNMQQPNIKFDLEFPTLTQDTYRKVKSIISTDDMMNRQIIYLLALNRFYTPDYMASTTKGNELFSVASSTISGQLSNMLGKLSDNWSISPNLRSDRGDFSDVEVDVALSSSLLNNRLLFNGNFGYRDKSLNTNQFVGDFDIEYLLDRSGTWRLKAYNRYNDQNYYLRTAQTTQGVGIILRRDFDDVLQFFRKKKKTPQEDIKQNIETINKDLNETDGDSIKSDEPTIEAAPDNTPIH